MKAYSAALDMRFRGKRNYVRSADVYPLILLHAANAGAPVAGDLRMDFSRIVACGLEISVYSKEAGSIDPVAPFTFAYSSACGNMVGHLTETHTPISQRYDGDDETIYRQIELAGDELSFFDRDGAFETIDMVAALAAQHERFVPASEGRQWLIARLELSKPLPSRGPRRICANIDRRLGKTSIRSNLSIDGRQIGRVFMVQGHV